MSDNDNDYREVELEEGDDVEEHISATEEVKESVYSGGTHTVKIGYKESADEEEEDDEEEDDGGEEGGDEDEE